MSTRVCTAREDLFCLLLLFFSLLVTNCAKYQWYLVVFRRCANFYAEFSIHIHRYKENKTGDEPSQKGKRKGKVERREKHTRKFMSLNMNMNNKREKKRIMTNGNLSQIWIMWRPDFARLSISLHTFYMYIEWRNINWQYFWLSCAQLTARKTIGKYFHRWHDSYKRKLIFLSLATCLYSLTHSSACRIRKKERERESKSESEKKKMSQK